MAIGREDSNCSVISRRHCNAADAKQGERVEVVVNDSAEWIAVALAAVFAKLSSAHAHDLQPRTKPTEHKP